MFKVICIDTDYREQGEIIGSDWSSKEGFKYTVIDDFFWCGIHAYVLREDPDNDIRGFEVDRFVLLSNIDETELVNTKEEVLS